MSSSNEVVAREQYLEVGGKQYRLAKFDAALYQRFLDYAKAALPDPVADLLPYLDRLPKELAAEQLEKALERKRLRGSLTDPDVEAWQTSEHGVKKMFALLLQVHQPHMSDDDCWQLFFRAVEQHGEQRLGEILQAAQGRTPMSEEEVEDRFFRQRRTCAGAKAARTKANAA